MSRLFLSLTLGLALLLTAETASAQTSGARSRNVKRGSTAKLAGSQHDQKIAPGMRLGTPLPLTTDYMGRPLKPKTPAQPVAKTSSSLSKTSASGKSTPKSKKTTVKR